MPTTTILDGETYLEALQRRYAEETKAEKQAEIIRMAREAGFDTDLPSFKDGTAIALKLAALVAAHEREACAKVCEEVAPEYEEGKNMATVCAAAIRARDMDLLTQHSQAIGEYDDYPRSNN